MLCRPAHVSIMSQGRENSSAAKEDRLKYVKFNWKGPALYRASRSTTQSFLGGQTIVTYIFEDFESPSKKFLATPLYTQT